MHECRHCNGIMHSIGFRRANFLHKIRGMHKLKCFSCGRKVILKPSFSQALYKLIPLKMSMIVIILTSTITAAVGTVSALELNESYQHFAKKDIGEALYKHIIFQQENGDLRAYNDYLINNCLHEFQSETPENMAFCMKKALSTNLLKMDKKADKAEEQ